MKDLQKVYEECIAKLESIGLDFGYIKEIKVNTRAVRRWGQCHREFAGWASNGERRYVYSINIASVLLDDRTPVEALHNTIIHEILHTCPGCWDHGYEWKYRAEKVKREIGYDIKRVNTQEEKGVSNEVYREYRKPKYILLCEKCGKHIGKYRMCGVVQYPYLYRCKCGGELKRIQ